MDFILRAKRFVGRLRVEGFGGSAGGKLRSMPTVKSDLCWPNNGGHVTKMEQKLGFDSLMEEVCVKYGWCGGIVDGHLSHVTDYIPKSGPITADQFVDWLFIAEGMDPSNNLSKWQKHKDYLRDAFIRIMGYEVVDASLLKWSLDSEDDEQAI